MDSKTVYPCARPIFEGNEISSLQIQILNTELRCPICLNLLREPVATECMHRFCAGCIQKCLRLGKKECPACRKPVATRRNLRTDTNFAALIYKLYPDLDDFEEEEEEQLEAAESRALLVKRSAAQLAGPPLADSAARQQQCGQPSERGRGAWHPGYRRCCDRRRDAAAR